MGEIVDFLKCFDTNVKKYASKCALKYKEHTYTYKMLDEKSNAISATLKQFGVKKNDIIGILMDRTEEIVFSILGILKLECTFLPIDKDYPEERINYIINDSKVKLLLTNFDLKIDGNIDLINIRNIDLTQHCYLEYNKHSSFYPYIIYTSGSTGNPKGVVIKYKALNNLLNSFVQILNLNESDIFLALTTVSFDISILELLLPLWVGCCVVLAPNRCQIDPYYLKKIINEYNVTIMQATPVTWKMLVDSNWDNPNDIKIICGGEALDEKLANNLLSIATNVWNVYGPTETTIWSSYYKLKSGNKISIGKPINNTIFKIFDNNIESNIGELYIGGSGLAKGYLHKRKLTREKFVTIDNHRYYKTGDIVKFENNNYYFLGRSDFQVKINGHRIELEEIEKNLSLIKDLKKAIVLYNSGTKEIIAFIIEDKSIKDQKIYEFLSKKLPNYMLPNVIIRLDAFPLTNNKKIDRKKLLNEYSEKRTFDYNKNIYELNLSSYDLINLMVKLEKNNTTLNIEKIWSGYSINDSIEKLRVVKNKNIVEPWFMQSLMFQYKLVYPDSKAFYEQISLKLPYKAAIIDNAIFELKKNLEIFNLGIKRYKNNFYFTYCENPLINIVRTQNVVTLKYHHSIIDGESIIILIETFLKILNEEKINYDLLNNYQLEISILNEKIDKYEKKHTICHLFTCENNQKEDYKFSYINVLKSNELIDFCNQNKLNITTVIQYIIAKSIFELSNRTIIFGLVNSNRLFMKNKLTIGNFINTVYQEYSETDLNNIGNYVNKLKSNRRHFYYKHNKENNYEILLIINDRRRFNNIVENANIKLKENMYEINNSPINIKCNINHDNIDIYISARNIVKNEEFSIFIEKIKYNFENLKGR